MLPHQLTLSGKLPHQHTYPVRKGYHMGCQEVCYIISHCQERYHIGSLLWRLPHRLILSGKVTTLAHLVRKGYHISSPSQERLPHRLIRLEKVTTSIHLVRRDYHNGSPFQERLQHQLTLSGRLPHRFTVSKVTTFAHPVSKVTTSDHPVRKDISSRGLPELAQNEIIYMNKNGKNSCFMKYIS